MATAPFSELNDDRHIEGIPGPGEVLAGKYRILEQLGRGGMGVVVAGEHLQLARPVAIKFLLPEIAVIPSAHDRFLREARAAARLQGDHALRILDVGSTDSGLPYMIMERLVGTDLAEVLERQGPLPVDEAVGYVLQACTAIAEAHAAGIVHRDLKPANLFLARQTDGSHRIKVLDFGISKTMAGDGTAPSTLTAPNAAMGSPQYMSPEQILDSSTVDGRTDIWSLGVILYQLLCNALPFDSPSVPHLYAVILTEPPRPLLERRPGIAPEIEAILRRCFEKEAAARIQDVVELGQLLEPFAPALSRRVRSSGSPRSAPRRASDSGAGDSGAGREGPQPGSRSAIELAETAAPLALQPSTTARRAASTARRVGVGVAIAVLALVVVATVGLGGSRAPEPPSTATAVQASAGGPTAPRPGGPTAPTGEAESVRPTPSTLPQPQPLPPAPRATSPAPTPRRAAPAPAPTAPSPQVRDLQGIKPLD